MSYNFQNGMPSAAMPQFGSLSNYGPQANALMGIDPSQANPLAFTSPPVTGDWVDPYVKPMGTGIPNLGASLPAGLPGNDMSSNWFKDLFGTKEAPTWGGMALGAAGGLASVFMGMKQYGLAKDTLANNKQQFQMQYDAQKQMTNANLEDRQRARVASNPGAYQSPSAYMSQYGVK